MTTQTETKPMPDFMTRGVIPYLQVDGAVAAIDFYKRALGAKEHARTTNDAGDKVMNCQLEINGGPLMLMDAMPEHGFAHQPSHSYTMQLVVDDGQAWMDRAVAAGATVATPFQQMFWGDKWGSVTDPYGVHWGSDEPPKA
ncbi:MAG TPA: VOC family protein [Caulobacteraceae bacterium]|nr:VOC family protein [Caulobacteraceae bacterium]